MDTPDPRPPSPRPKRRPRYSGTHPRRFEEKYKEHDPERYANDVAHIVASGKTLAGTHRPILVQEVLAQLNPQPGETAVDATLGYGGHTTELLRRLQPGGRLLALDVDPLELPKTEARLREAGFGTDVLTVTRSNFAGLPQAMSAAGLEGADVFLADLGLSSMQIDNPARGFTFKWDGPFDLRLNPERGQSAARFIAGLGPEKLASILKENADEPAADRLAAALIPAAARGELETTLGVARVIRAALEGDDPKRSHGKPETEQAIRRVFQAIRIAVNDEFGALDTLLRHLPNCLKPGGRAAILTFHSGEDRRVKKAFAAGRESGLFAKVAEEVIRPTHEETRANPRAASAKLRWAVRSS